MERKNKSGDASPDLPPILVVEDVETDRYAAVKLLGASFANPVLEAANGEEAIALIEQSLANRGNTVPCLALIDLRLPKITGQKLLDWCAKVGALKETVFGILTNYPADATVSTTHHNIPVFAKPLNAPGIASWLATDPRVKVEHNGGRRRISRSSSGQTSLQAEYDSQEGELGKMQKAAEATRESIERIKKILREEPKGKSRRKD